ncbi:MAG: hypothetical protein MMC33_000461 [Icmadophila ericetorum]|nr:hypothetical protein [Icmadophila ericetorum]
MSNQRGRGESSASGSTGGQKDDWTGASAPGERRKIQNRNAQRKFRSKEKQKKEDQVRIQENAHAAGSSYAAPEAEDMGSVNPNGLPWGSFPIEQGVKSGKKKAKDSQQDSQESSSSEQGYRSGLWGCNYQNIGQDGLSDGKFSEDIELLERFEMLDDLCVGRDFCLHLLV